MTPELQVVINALASYAKSNSDVGIDRDLVDSDMNDIKIRNAEITKILKNFTKEFILNNQHRRY